MLVGVSYEQDEKAAVVQAAAGDVSRAKVVEKAAAEQAATEEVPLVCFVASVWVITMAQKMPMEALMQRKQQPRGLLQLPRHSPLWAVMVRPSVSANG